MSEIITNCKFYSRAEWGSHCCSLYEPTNPKTLVEYGTCDANEKCPYKNEQLQQLKAEVKSKTEYIQEQRDIINQYSKEIEMYKKCQGKRASKREEELKAENESLQSLNDFNVQKIETLEAKNEFKESQINDWIKQYKLAHQKYMKLQTKNEKYKECLDEIEEICKTTICDYPMNKVEEIMKLIKQVKEGGE